MKKIIGLIVLIVATILFWSVDRVEEFESPLSRKRNPAPPVLIQLFTSQGCSSCPPADALLEEIAAEHPEKNFQVLSYHVDYWNRLGWKDPFSQKTFTKKQYAYADQFNSNRVYTPQAVVNGRYEFTGSSRSKMQTALSKTSTNNSDASIKISNVQANGKSVTATITGSTMPSGSKLYVAAAVKERETKIARGENRNRRLRNIHIVAAERSWEVDSTEEQQFKVQLDLPEWVRKEDELFVTGYLQNSKGHTIAVNGTTISR